MSDGKETEAPAAPFSPVRPADAEAMTLAKKLVRGARFGAIGVLEPETGDPSVSRVLTGTDSDGTPVILASMLTMHMKALIANGRCSLLLGEPGKGDPLAWPRITLTCQAEVVIRDNESHLRIRERFLRRHGKAKLYVDFPDFSFLRLCPIRGSLNGGFGRAFTISGKDLLMEPLDRFSSGNSEIVYIEALLELDPAAGDRIAKTIFKEKTEGWSVVGLDREGLEVGSGARLLRWEWERSIENTDDLKSIYKNYLNYTR